MRPRPLSSHRAAPVLLLSSLALVACANAGSSGDDDDDIVDVDARVAGQPDAAPVGTPDATPVGTPDATPGGTPDAAPGGTPDATPGGTPDAAPGGGAACDEAALLPDNDTCAAAIDLTAAAAMAGGVTTYGDTRGYVNDAEPLDTACTGGYGQDGPDAVYAISATAGDTLSVTMTPEGYDGSIYILSTCTDANTCELGADAAFVSGAETISYPVSADATYYLLVDSYLATEEGCYTLHVEIL